MREIKFRFWNKDFTEHSREEKRQMVYVDLKNADNLTDYNIEFLFFNFVAMQFTGLKDKNGKEIYEGDILKRGLTFDGVIFDEGAFCIKFYSLCFKKTYTHSMKSTLSDKINKWEVIGNIYENKELLGEVK